MGLRRGDGAFRWALDRRRRRGPPSRRVAGMCDRWFPTHGLLIVGSQGVKDAAPTRPGLGSVYRMRSVVAIEG